jgi:hypothetical protein
MQEADNKKAAGVETRFVKWEEFFLAQDSTTHAYLKAMTEMRAVVLRQKARQSYDDLQEYTYHLVSLAHSLHGANYSAIFTTVKKPSFWAKTMMGTFSVNNPLCEVVAVSVLTCHRAWKDGIRAMLKVVDENFRVYEGKAIEKTVDMCILQLKRSASLLHFLQSFVYDMWKDYSSSPVSDVTRTKVLAICYASLMLAQALIVLGRNGKKMLRGQERTALLAECYSGLRILTPNVPNKMISMVSTMMLQCLVLHHIRIANTYREEVFPRKAVWMLRQVQQAVEDQAIPEVLHQCVDHLIVHIRQESAGFFTEELQDIPVGHQERFPVPVFDPEISEYPVISRLCPPERIPHEHLAVFRFVARVQ